MLIRIRLLALLPVLLMIDCAHGRDVGNEDASTTRTRLTLISRVAAPKARAVVADSKYAWVAQGLEGMTLIDVSSPANPRIAAKFPSTKVQAVEIAQADEKTLVIGERTRGLTLWNTANPLAPVPLGSLALPAGANDISVFRRGSNTYAALSCAGAGLLFARITDAANPTLAGRYTLDIDFARRSLIDGNVAFLADHFDGGLKVLDIRELDAPRLMLKVQLGGFCESVAFGNEALFVGYRNYGTRVFKPDIPTDLYTTPSIRLLSTFRRSKNRVRALATSGNFLVIADDEGGVDLYDITNPAYPVLADEYRFRRERGAAAYDVLIRDDLVFVPAWDAGLLIFKIESGPENPPVDAQAGALDTNMPH